MTDRASKRIDGRHAAVLAIAGLLAAMPAAGQDAASVGAGGEAGGSGGSGGLEPFEPSSAFGFGGSTSTLDVGKMDFQFDTTGRWDRRDGAYATATLGMQAARGVVEGLELGVTASAQHFDISGVPEVDDTDRFRFVGVGAVYKWRLRETDDEGRVGLAVELNPRWAGVSGDTGTREDSLIVDARATGETAFVPNRLYGALGVTYTPTWTWPEEGEEERSSALDVSGSLAARVGPNAFVGAEARLASSFEGVALDRFAGRALYLGPTVSFRVAEGTWVSGAFEVQVAGEEGDEPDRDLDLTNYERFEVGFELKRQF